MNDHLDLSRSFLEHRPVECARMLEAVPAADAAALLATCPAHVAAPVLAAMSAAAAAELLERLPADVAKSALDDFTTHQAAAVLRGADRNRAERLSALLPRRISHDVSRILNYSPDLVGAWCRAATPTFPPDIEAGKALEKIRQTTDVVELIVLEVGEHKYGGAIPLARIVQAKPRQRLRGLILSDLTPLYDRSTLASVATLQVWSVHNVVPVVDRQNRLVGVLFERTLRDALGDIQARARTREEDSSTLLSLTSGYTRVLSSALDLMEARWQPPENANLPRRKERRTRKKQSGN